eukprot:3417839-Rhodomonas_salina.2
MPLLTDHPCGLTWTFLGWPDCKCVLNFGESTTEFKHFPAPPSSLFLKVADVRQNTNWRDQINGVNPKELQERIRTMKFKNKKLLIEAAEDGRAWPLEKFFGRNKAKLVRWSGPPESCCVYQDQRCVKINEIEASSTFVTVAVPGCLLQRSSRSKAYYELHILSYDADMKQCDNVFCQVGFASLTLPKTNEDDWIGVGDFLGTWCVDGLRAVRFPPASPCVCPRHLVPQSRYRSTPIVRACVTVNDCRACNKRPAGPSDALGVGRCRRNTGTGKAGNTRCAGRQGT